MTRRWDSARKAALFVLACAFAEGASIFPATAAEPGCNSGSTASDASSKLLSDAACHGHTAGQNTIAVGAQTWALAEGSSVFGSNAFASGKNGTVIGHLAGNLDEVDGITAIGASAGPSAGFYSTAIGAGFTRTTAPRATGPYAVAFGGGDGAPYFGLATLDINGALATGYASSAVGAAAVATGRGSSAYGFGSKATGADSTAYGEFSAAIGRDSVAVGLLSRAAAASSVAIGRRAIARHDSSVAIGENSVTTAAHTISVGGNGRARRIMNVAAGSAATDSVNLNQVRGLIAAASDKNDAMQPGRQVDAQLKDVRQQLAALQELVERQNTRIAELEGGAVRAAQGVNP